jgi:membrane protein
MIDRSKRIVTSLDAWTMRHRLTRITRRAIVGFLEHDALQYAGGMAYFSVLSIFQLLVLASVVTSLFLGESEARQFVVDQIAAGSPLDPELIGDMIDSVIASRGGITLFGLVLLAWGALGFFSSLSRGIGRVFEPTSERPFIKQQLLGLLLMGLTGLLVLASLVIGLVTGILRRIAADYVDQLPGGDTVLWLFGFTVPIVLVFVAFWVLYRVVPSRRVTWSEVLPGAIVATILWTVLRFGFTYYATNVANYDSAFGPVSTAISLLVFLYFASLVILIGAEFARARTLEDEAASIREADPRFLPVPTETPPRPAAPPTGGGGLRRLAVIIGAALVGIVVGRVTKREDE